MRIGIAVVVSIWGFAVHFFDRILELCYFGAVIRVRLIND